jgi:hypothetical protein
MWCGLSTGAGRLQGGNTSTFLAASTSTSGGCLCRRWARATQKDIPLDAPASRSAGGPYLRRQLVHVVHQQQSGVETLRYDGILIDGKFDYGVAPIVKTEEDMILVERELFYPRGGPGQQPQLARPSRWRTNSRSCHPGWTRGRLCD